MIQNNTLKHYLSDTIKTQKEISWVTPEAISFWREYIDQQYPDILGQYTHDVPRMRELFKSYAWRELTPNRAWDEFRIMWKNYGSEIQYEMKTLKKLGPGYSEILEINEELFSTLYKLYTMTGSEVSKVQDADIFWVSQPVYVAENTTPEIQEVVLSEVPIFLNKYREPVSHEAVYGWVGDVKSRRERKNLGKRKSSKSTYADLKKIIETQLKIVFSNVRPSNRSDIFGDYLLETIAAPIQFPYISPLKTSSSALSQDIQLTVKCILGPVSRDRIFRYLYSKKNQISFEKGMAQKFTNKAIQTIHLKLALVVRIESIIGRTREDQKDIDISIEMPGRIDSKEAHLSKYPPWSC